MFSTVLGGLGIKSVGGLFGDMFSTGALSKANDVWGSFTGTSASVFLEAGAKSVQQAEQNLQSNLASNPSAAFTEFSRFLSDELARYTNAFKNSSQSKTREGNKKSMADIKKAILNIPTLERKLKDSYSISKITKQGTRTDFGKYTTKYSYSEFKFSDKPTAVKTIKNLTSETLEAKSTPFVALGVGALAFLFFIKKFK
jgi:hypothetical protein